MIYLYLFNLSLAVQDQDQIQAQLLDQHISNNVQRTRSKLLPVTRKEIIKVLSNALNNKSEIKQLQKKIIEFGKLEQNVVKEYNNTIEIILMKKEIKNEMQEIQKIKDKQLRDEKFTEYHDKINSYARFIAESTINDKTGTYHTLRDEIDKIINNESQNINITNQFRQLFIKHDQDTKTQLKQLSSIIEKAKLCDKNMQNISDVELKDFKQRKKNLLSMIKKDSKLKKMTKHTKEILAIYKLLLGQIESVISCCANKDQHLQRISKIINQYQSIYNDRYKEICQAICKV